MCGRYSFPTDKDIGKFQDMIDRLNSQGKKFATGTVTPGMDAAVMARNRRLECSPFVMHWGYTLNGGKLVFNARSETASEKAMFSDGIRQRRCAVPAVSWYEWEHNGSTKEKYELSPASSEGFWLAGIYRMEENGPAFTILTRPCSENISFIHDRMPVVIPDEELYRWLDPGVDAETFLRSEPPVITFEKTDR